MQWVQRQIPLKYEWILTIQKYLKTRNMIFFSKLNLSCCHFKINQYKHTYDQLAHMILLTLHSSMFTMAIIFSSSSVVFFYCCWLFSDTFFSISCCVFLLKFSFRFHVNLWRRIQCWSIRCWSIHGVFGVECLCAICGKHIFEYK